MGRASVQARRAESQGSRRAERRRDKARAARTKRVAIVGAILAVLATVVTVVALVAGGGGSGNDSAEAAAVDVPLGDYTIPDLTVPAGPVTLRARNVGIDPHDLGVSGEGMPNGMPKITTTLLSGQEAELDLGELRPGTYRMFCDIADHVARGMVATLTVTAAAPSAATTTP